MFSVIKSSEYGRIGQLTNKEKNFSTPLLFPVVCLVTGTTARGGGLWKYVLQADQANGLLRRNLPVMSQVLHFLDFAPNNFKSVEKWRKLGIKQRYFEDVVPQIKYEAPLFLDSGGFQLLSKKSIDLSAYNLSLEGSKGYQSILRLQEEFGGDIIATLDYPLPPKLIKSEAEDRMNRSLENAVKSAYTLQKNQDWSPFYMWLYTDKLVKV